MTVIIVGAGSAALHFADACESLGTEYTVVTRSESRQNEFFSRFVGRYGNAPKCSFLDIREPVNRKCVIGIVATPPLSHGEVAEYVLQFGPRLIFVDKPLGMSREGVNRVLEAGARLLCGSQIVLRPSFAAFVEETAEALTAPGVRIRSQYCEPLSGPAMAHPWDLDFADGWVTNESGGGGVLSEFSHALFWIGWLLESNGLPHAPMGLDEFSAQVNRRGRMALSKVGMSTHSVGGAAITVLQSWQTDVLERSLSVTSEAASFQLRFGATSDTLLRAGSEASPIRRRDFGTDRRVDTKRLIRHLIDVSKSPRTESPLSIKTALWVDEVIKYIRSQAALRV